MASLDDTFKKLGWSRGNQIMTPIDTALGNLEEAARLTQLCRKRGPCPLTKTEIDEAASLAQSAAIILLDLDAIGEADGEADGEA